MSTYPVFPRQMALGIPNAIPRIPVEGFYNKASFLAAHLITLQFSTHHAGSIP
jgi:hypothetical protein